LIDLLIERLKIEFPSLRVKPSKSEYDIYIGKTYINVSFRDGSLGDFEIFYGLLKSEIDHFFNMKSSNSSEKIEKINKMENANVDVKRTFVRNRARRNPKRR